MYMPMPILEHPDARLRRAASAVERFDARLRTLAARMQQTLRAAGGIGLAAPQVGVALRLVVLEPDIAGDAPLVLVNPRILARERLCQAREEGCLSLPGVRMRIERAAGVIVHAQDARGRAFAFEARGLLAACVQHELEHLEGRLLIDHARQARGAGA